MTKEELEHEVRILNGRCAMYRSMLKKVSRFGASLTPVERKINDELTKEVRDEQNKEVL